MGWDFCSSFDPSAGMGTKAYALNANEFAAVLPSMHVKPVFSWVRPIILR